MSSQAAGSVVTDENLRIGDRRYGMSILAAALLAIGYAALLFWFQRMDFYHTHFFDHGTLVAFYQVARLVFTVYLAWLIYVVGAGLMTLTFGAAVSSSLAPYERYPLYFTVGAAVWHIVLFATGLAGLDIKPVMLTLALGIMWLSVPHLAACLREARASVLATPWRLTTRRGLLQGVVLLGVAAAAGLFLLTKGLYPAGGHDYFNHYFQFYKRVIETGSILPNDVWYHFFYSKGAGLYFMAMLLTDPLAPQLVTSSFVGCGAAMVFALLKHLNRSPLLPWVGVFLFFAVFIYTPGPALNAGHGGWADLEKIHELTAVLLLAVVWTCARLFAGDVTLRGPWWLALSAAIIGIAILTFVLMLLVGAYMVLFTAWLASRGRWRAALQPVAAGALVGACLFAVGAINYHYTGMPTDLFVVQLWPYFDLNKIQEWGTLYEVLNHHRAYYNIANSSPASLSWHSGLRIAEFLRLELWWPLFAAAAPLVIWNLLRRKVVVTIAPSEGNTAVALILFALAVMPAAVLSGSLVFPYSISFYRLSTFSYAPALCAALLVWAIALRECPDRRLLPMFVAIAVVVEALFVLRMKGPIRQIAGNATQLAIGNFSLRDAYRNQQGWPGRSTYGAIYPAMEKVWGIVGPRTRIWGFNVHSYCMLPECNIQGSLSFRFSPSWQTIIFRSTDEAAETLKKEGLNYFFFSSEDQLSHDDLLPASRLFAPDEIGRYLGIKWTDGTSYLLTWLGPGVEPISDKFLADLRARMGADGYSVAAARQLWQPVSEYITAHKDDLRPFAGSWCTNFAIRCQ